MNIQEKINLKIFDEFGKNPEEKRKLEKSEDLISKIQNERER